MKDSRTEPLLIAAGLAALGAAALAVNAFLVEPVRIQVTEHEMPLPDLPAAWEGARVVHLTDLHYGDPRSDWLFEWAVRTVNAMDADLIVMTGDYVLEKTREVEPAVRHLLQLRAKQGVVAVLGDHDFCPHCQALLGDMTRALRDGGMRVLRNESVELPGGLRIAGVDPRTGKIKRADLNAALRDLNGTKPHLLLAHSPDIIRDAARQEVPMVLCGHTHGGQVVVPFYGPPITHTRVGRKYASGWASHNGTRLYTSRGLGSHLSLRFLCRPEIAVFTLRRG
jgi:uncharacterized protein